jgi:hypothetical protein
VARENPTLVFNRSLTYVFDVDATGNPFAIHTVPASTVAGARYTKGVTGAPTAKVSCFGFLEQQSDRGLGRA